MGIAEIRALKLGGKKLYDDDSPVQVTPTGPKPKKALKQVSDKKKVKDAETKAAGGDPDKKALDLWYHNIAYQISPGQCHCWECNEYIPAPFIRHATAHIFPKAAFPSVMTHPDNYLILGAGCCHDKTHTVERFKKMGIWREAVERFLKFEHLLTPEEKGKDYYTLFRDAAKESFPKLFNNQNAN
jgi:hypothetical protein